MVDFIPKFDFYHVFASPWTQNGTSFMWIAIMGFLVNATCGMLGNYLILRRLALVGDAISHSVLPGMAIAFILSNNRGSLSMFIGALFAGIVTTIIIEVIHKKTRVKQDSAIGITFTSLFAIGVILITLYADKVDLDQDCVLYGEIGTVWMKPFVQWGDLILGPTPVVRMAVIALFTTSIIILFYKELLVSSFDPGLASSLGINATVIHYGLMSLLSLVVVSAFESVGAILVIAMLILPGATASLLSQRFPIILLLSVAQAGLNSILGINLSIWLDCSIAGAMVVVGTILFGLAWFFNPMNGLVPCYFRNRMGSSMVYPENLE